MNTSLRTPESTEVFCYVYSQHVCDLTRNWFKILQLPFSVCLTRSFWQKTNKHAARYQTYSAATSDAVTCGNTYVWFHRTLCIEKIARTKHSGEFRMVAAPGAHPPPPSQGFSENIIKILGRHPPRDWRPPHPGSSGSAPETYHLYTVH